MSRSELYATAVAEFLAKHTASEVTARLDAIYGAESSELDPAFRQAQSRTIGPELW